MTVINKKLEAAIHTVIDTVAHNLRITIVQPKHEHNIPWHYINKDYLFKIEASMNDWVQIYSEEQEVRMENLFKTRYATNPKHLASIIRGHLCFALDCDPLNSIPEYEADTGSFIQMPGCPEEEVDYQDGHELITTVEMLDWHYDQERKANDPFWGRDEDEDEIPSVIVVDRNAPF